MFQRIHFLISQALLEILIGCRVFLSGDTINPGEGSIIIMNHRNRLDWFFLWAALLHGTKPPAHRCKFVLKSGVKEIPGIGWGLQLAGFLYIHRNWEQDQRLLARSLDYFKDLGNTYQVWSRMDLGVNQN
jgi:lysocardiolipin and lysophospholipid acyltransferase